MPGSLNWLLGRGARRAGALGAAAFLVLLLASCAGDEDASTIGFVALVQHLRFASLPPALEGARPKR